MASPLLIVVVLGLIAFLSYRFLLSKKKPQSKAGKAEKAPPSALSLRDYSPYKLIEKRDLTTTLHKTSFYRFALPDGHRLGLPVGKHISLKFTDAEGKTISRPYTPVSSDDDIGHFDLVVKIYSAFEIAERKIPAGIMGTYMNAMKVGDVMDVKGPLGEIEYKGNGVFTVGRRNEETKERKVQTVAVRRLGMIAGGTGITPMLAIIRDIIKHPEDPTHMSLIFANQTEEDILLREELEAIAKKYPERFSLHLTLDRPPAGWSGSTGFVSGDMISKHLTPPSASGDHSSFVLLCGPPAMIGFVGKALTGLKYAEEDMAFFKN
jgi:cytochrome-b5 reductase